MVAVDYAAPKGRTFSQVTQQRLKEPNGANRIAKITGRYGRMKP